MSSQTKTKSGGFYDDAIAAADKRILEMIDAEIKQIHPAYRQAAHTAIRVFSRESHLFDGTEEQKEAVFKDLRRFNGLTMIDDIQAETIERSLRMMLRMYIMRRHEVARVRKGLTPKLINETAEPVINNRRKPKVTVLKLVR